MAWRDEEPRKKKDACQMYIGGFCRTNSVESLVVRRGKAEASCLVGISCFSRTPALFLLPLSLPHKDEAPGDHTDGCLQRRPRLTCLLTYDVNMVQCRQDGPVLASYRPQCWETATTCSSKSEQHSMGPIK